MGRGGHVRSGRPVDPTSARSDRRGVTTAVLPVTGYQGRLPGLNKHLPRPTSRHREVWEQLWRYPQATRWITEPWRWPVVAELVRLMVLTEQPGTVAVATYSAIRQRRDDLGLSPAGLRAEGWEVATGVATGQPPAAAGPVYVDQYGNRNVDQVGQRRRRLREHVLCPDGCREEH